MAIYRQPSSFQIIFAGMSNHPVPEARPRTQTPLSISIIGWIMVVAGFVALPMAFLRLPLGFFGVFLTGWSATVGIFLLALAYILIGYGLLRLSREARIAGIALFALLVLNGFIFSFIPETHARMLDAMKGSPLLAQSVDRPVPPPAPFPIRLLKVAVFGVPLWFLFTRKKAFDQSPADSAATM